VETHTLRANSMFDPNAKRPRTVIHRRCKIGSPPPSATNWRELYLSSFPVPISNSLVAINN
jgi:hypothetical protein